MRTSLTAPSGSIQTKYGIVYYAVQSLTRVYLRTDDDDDAKRMRVRGIPYYLKTTLEYNAARGKWQRPERWYNESYITRRESQLPPSNAAKETMLGELEHVWNEFISKPENMNITRDAENYRKNDEIMRLEGKAADLRAQLVELSLKAAIIHSQEDGNLPHVQPPEILDDTPTIKVWPFDKAPKGFQYSVGGDEDWVAWVPPQYASANVELMFDSKNTRRVDYADGAYIIVCSHS
jgi:hypothetical protein